MPSWLKPPDPASHLLQGFSEGAAVSEANARLQAQSQQTQVELQVKQQQAAQQAARQQQQIEISRAYHEAQIGVQQQKLQQAKQVSDMKIQQAAQAFQAQGQYAQDYQSMVDGGMSEGDASIKAALKNPGFLKGGSGLAAVSRAAQASVPKNLEITDQGGKQFYRSSPTEAYKMVPGGSEDKVMEHQPAIAGFKSIAQMETELRTPGMKEADRASISRDLDDEKRRVNEMYKSRKMTPPFPKLESGKTKLDETTAMYFLNEARGDKEKARSMAKDAGSNLGGGMRAGSAAR